jgi:zinc transporter, ZIP family
MPTLSAPNAVVLWSFAAIIPAGLGAFLGVHRLGAARRRDERVGPAERLLGWANASAAGLMLGIAFAVLSAALPLSPVAGTVGAAVGVCVVHLFGKLAGSSEVPARAVLASALHSAAEGIAIGAATAFGAAFGSFLVLTFAFHNVSEGAVLGSTLAGGRRPRAATGAAMLARTGQPLLAVATLLAVGAVPALLPWALGVAFGALVYLVLAELLPASYHQSGRTSIAVVVSVAAGIVALLGGRAR